MRMQIPATPFLLRFAFKKWYEKDPFRESAVIPYYAIFSLPGLLVLVITLAGYCFGKEAYFNVAAGARAVKEPGRES